MIFFTKTLWLQIQATQNEGGTIADWNKMIAWESGDDYNEDIWFLGELEHLELNIPIYETNNDNDNSSNGNNTLANVFRVVGLYFVTQQWWMLSWAHC